MIMCGKYFSHPTLVRNYIRCTANEVSAVSCPVLILQGRGDRLTPVGGAQRLHSALKNCKIHIIDKAGHQVRCLR
jgi:pimeloyl-ACP methyl ester carboxylesterase